MRLIYIVILILISIATNCIGQNNKSTVISGRVSNSDGSTLNKTVIIFNNRSSYLKLDAATGGFSIIALHNDTISFIAYGFIEKKICMHDSAYKMRYKLSIRLDSIHEGIITDTNSTNNTINNLYVRFSGMDTLKLVKRNPLTTKQKYGAMKKILSIYVSNKIAAMTTVQFYDFISYMLEQGGKELWRENSRQLITQAQKLYMNYTTPLFNADKEPTTSNKSNNTENIKGHGAGLGLIFLSELIKGLSSGEN